MHMIEKVDAGGAESTLQNLRTNAIHSLHDQMDTLVPRWKGVALTAAAELEAEQGNDNAENDKKKKKLPWINVKFSHYPHAGKTLTIGSDKYRGWDQIGVATGESMTLHELAKYKYHIDFGGGGGTTWSGTIEKLALPGLLFHHVTPMKDYIHDHLVPWRHYIPVSADLNDLKSKFDWAESHPVEAKRIADEGTKFMRELGTPQGFEKIFEQDFVKPLRQVIEAYRPVSSVHGNDVSWKEVIASASSAMANADIPSKKILPAGPWLTMPKFAPVMECSGYWTRNTDSCQLLATHNNIVPIRIIK